MTQHYRQLLASLAILLGVAGFLFAIVRESGTSKSTASRAVTFTGATMGTTYSVKVAGLPAALGQDQVADKIQTSLDQINALMSTYIPESELSRFNAHTGQDWLSVSPETARVVAEAIRVGERSNGALDVTIGPVVDLWSFGPEARPEGVIPNDQQIAAALATVGFTQLEVRLDPPALRKKMPDCRVDLSALAKGFAVDQVARTLESLGIDRFMVEVGGEIRTAGHNPNDRPWQIAVEVPTTFGRGIQRVVTHRAIARWPRRETIATTSSTTGSASAISSTPAQVGPCTIAWPR